MKTSLICGYKSKCLEIVVRDNVGLIMVDSPPIALISLALTS